MRVMPVSEVERSVVQSAVPTWLKINTSPLVGAALSLQLAAVVNELLLVEIQYLMPIGLVLPQCVNHPAASAARHVAPRLHDVGAGGVDHAVAVLEAQGGGGVDDVADVHPLAGVLTHQPPPRRLHGGRDVIVDDGGGALHDAAAGAGGPRRAVDVDGGVAEAEQTHRGLSLLLLVGAFDAA